MYYFIELTTKKKLSIALAFTLIIMTAITYNNHKKKQQEKMLEVIIKYKQAKNIHCGDRDINSSTYSLSIGTYTFIGKKNTPHYAEMIDALTCQ